MNVRDLAARVAPLPPAPGSSAAAAAPLQGPAFGELLTRALDAPRVSVSAHAGQRVEQRGIDLSAPVLSRIAEALDTLHTKGATDALLVGADAAFVVNVPNRTVVTALDPAEMQARVVTQIDSAMLL
jgi:flagellar operon protein